MAGPLPEGCAPTARPLVTVTSLQGRRGYGPTSPTGAGGPPRAHLWAAGLGLEPGPWCCRYTARARDARTLLVAGLSRECDVTASSALCDGGGEGTGTHAGKSPEVGVGEGPRQRLADPPRSHTRTLPACVTVAAGWPAGWSAHRVRLAETQLIAFCPVAGVFLLQGRHWGSGAVTARPGKAQIPALRTSAGKVC